jgi:transposase-like protein
MRRRPPRRQFTAEFKQDTVALMQRRECSYRELSEELGIPQNTLRGWYIAEEMARKKGKHPKSGLVRPPEQESAEQRATRLEKQLAEAQRKIERLEEDRAILKKAAAFFAKESE